MTEFPKATSRLQKVREITDKDVILALERWTDGYGR